MPHHIVYKLQKLMEQDFVDNNLKPTAALNNNNLLLPDTVLDAIDIISIACKRLFGPNIQPTKQQQYIMTSAGFPVVLVYADIIGWKTAGVQTPKGLICYS